MAFLGKSGIRTSVGKLSIVQLLVLVLLKENPAHGYDILQKLKDRLGAWNLRSGTVYPVLHKLLEKELVVGVDIPQEGSPNAIEYSLTPQGRNVLHEALHSLDGELQVQEDLWQFLSNAFTPGSMKRIRQWTVREQSPIGFVVMRQHCGSHCKGAPHVEFLKQYKEYLQKELDWVSEQLVELKRSE